MYAHSLNVNVKNTKIKYKEKEEKKTELRKDVLYPNIYNIALIYIIRKCLFEASKFSREML